MYLQYYTIYPLLNNLILYLFYNIYKFNLNIKKSETKMV